MLDISPLIDIDNRNKRFRIKRDAYRDPEVFEREKQIIFNRCWLYIGHESELKDKGDFITRTIGGRELIFVRDRKNRIRALFNSCTHRGAQVCREPRGRAMSFTCCYHGWTFTNDGKLMSQNCDHGYSEQASSDENLDLHEAPRLEDYRGFYFINYNPNAISLSDYLADAKDAIDALCDQSEEGMVILPGEHSYSINANYKFLVENSADGYHLTMVHESYLEFLEDRLKGTPQDGAIDQVIKAYYENGDAVCLGNGHSVLNSYVPTGRPVAAWIPPWGPEIKKEIDAVRARLESQFGKERADYIADAQKNLTIFPNLIINDIMSITVRYIEPVTVDHIRVNSWSMGPAEESEALRALRLDNYVSFLGPAGFGSPDDIEMLELCQKGATRTPVEYSELSKGFAGDEDSQDIRLRKGLPDDEVQMQGYWAQWDLMMRNIDKLEV